MDYVDLHCHLLPGIDDGPSSFAESIELLEGAWRAGTRRLVATPHMFQAGLGSDDTAWIGDRFAEFERRLAAHRESRGAAAGEAMELALGAENYAGETFLRALADGRVLTLGGSRYLLVELWPMETAAGAARTVDAVQDRGLVPVLAHVERYAFLQSEPRRLEQLVAAGCVAQVNASAVIGRHGLRLAQLVDRWLREGWIAVVASDGHGATGRPAELAEAAECLRSRYGETAAEACLGVNPTAILADGDVVRPPARKTSRWWRRGR